jgi:16S rRNA (guanine966-N2)-methyltransferase
MRIIGGKYRRRQLRVLSAGISPTKDSLRESIFNILMPKIVNASVLDLYAGSGAFGIEAIARGAHGATLVDVDIKSIEANIQILESEDLHKVQVVRQDALEYIKKAAEKGFKYDLIFLDPPYHKGLIKKSLHLLFDYDILLADGLIIAEYERKADFTINNSDYIDYRQIKSHKTSVSFIKKQA